MVPCTYSTHRNSPLPVQQVQPGLAPAAVQVAVQQVPAVRQALPVQQVPEQVQAEQVQERALTVRAQERALTEQQAVQVQRELKQQLRQAL